MTSGGSVGARQRIRRRSSGATRSQMPVSADRSPARSRACRASNRSPTVRDRRASASAASIRLATAAMWRSRRAPTTSRARRARRVRDDPAHDRVRHGSPCRAGRRPLPHRRSPVAWDGQAESGRLAQRPYASSQPMGVRVRVAAISHRRRGQGPQRATPSPRRATGSVVATYQPGASAGSVRPPTSTTACWSWEPSRLTATHIN
jgi:hypothetical protein